MATPTKQPINLDELFGARPLPPNPLNPSISVEQAKAMSWDQIVDSAHSDAKVNARSIFNEAKVKTFGADLDHHQFERYYQHPNFSKLGFNPYLDNEARYNAASSFTDDFRRTWGQWKTMVWDAGVDAAGFGPESDREAAKNMEKAMAIGTSTRGGIGGFTNNLFLNSGYTFGVMAEIMAEEALLFGATVLTGGIAGGAAAARTGVNIARATKALMNAAEWSKKANKIVSALDKLHDVGTARTVYNAMASGAQGAGKFVARNTLGETYNFLSNFDKLENLSGVAKTVQGFGSFYRDVRNVRLAFSESALEGGGVENEMLETGYDDFLRKNGRAPNDEEAAKIKQMAKSAALGTTWANLPVIFFSNQIVLGNYTKSFSPLRKLMPIEDNKFYKTLLTKEGIQVVEKNFKNAAKALIKPKTYGTFGLNYISANLAEGLQESAQEVIAGANKQYYSNLYNNKTRGGYYDSIADNIAKQFSGEGLEIFASGFFMGGIVSGASNIAVGAKDRAGRLINKGYASERDNAIKEGKRKAAILDEVYKDPLKYNNLHVNNMINQQQLNKEMTEAEKEGDAKKFQDAKWSSQAEQFYTVLETGMEDTFLQRYQELQSLSDEELVKTVSGDNAAEARKSLSEMASKVQEFKKSYEFVKKELGNPFKPQNYKEGTPERIQESNGYVAFRDAQKDLIFMRENFKNTAKRMDSIVREAVTDARVPGAIASDITNLFGLPTMIGEIIKLREETKILGDDETVTPDAKRLKSEKTSKLKNLEAFVDAMQDVVTEQSSNAKDGKAPVSDKVIQTKENKISATVYNKAYKAYAAYMKGLAKGPVFDNDLSNSFNKLVDHYLLNDENIGLANSVNTLINPTSFYEYARRKKEVVDVEYANRKERIQQALDSYQKIKDQNKLLQELYKRNVFFDAAEWEALNTQGKMPKRLYRVTGKDQILTTSTLYNDAVTLIGEYSINVNNIPLQYNTDLDQYDTDVRDKLPGDNRSYNDIAEQFGFDPKASKTTLPLRDVLQTIVDSDFATEQEQALARRLMTLAKADETVTFSKELAAPGIYTEADQTVIDARYSSEEYAKNAQSYPIETSILREEVNRRVLDMLKTDSAFQNSVREIYTAANEYYREGRMQGFYDKKFLGLRAMDDFVREALTNDNFREFLHEVRFESTGKSAWGEFVTKIVDDLSVTVGDFSDTALNAVINVVTTRIDANYSKAQAQAAGTPVTEQEILNPRELSIEEIETLHPGLVDELIKLYQGYNAIFAEIGDTAKMLDPDYATKTPEEIKNSPQFREYVKTNVSENLRNAFDKYFKKEAEVRTISRRPGIKQTITETDQTQLFIQQRNKLVDLGYTEDEINDMSILEGLNIINQGETKAQTAERLQQERNDLNADRDAARQEVIDEINDIQNINEFLAVEAELLANLSGNAAFRTRTGFRAEELNELFNNKRKELAFKTEYDDIYVGDFIIIKNLARNKQGVYEVYFKNEIEIKARDANGTEWTIKSGTFKADNAKRYVFKYSKEMNEEDLVQNPISPQEQNVSNDDVSAIQNLSDDDIANAITQGEKMNEDDAKQDFLDSLDDIC
jgi:hypothetical protein